MTYRSFLLTALAAALFVSCKDEPQPEKLPYWQDINVTSINAETRRTETVFFPTREAALKSGFRQSPNYVDLNGTWDFRYFDDHHDMEAFVAGIFAGGDYGTRAPSGAAMERPRDVKDIEAAESPVANEESNRMSPGGPAEPRGKTKGPEWGSIRVPGNWEVQGYGVAIYTNIAYDFCPKDPQPPTLPEVVPGGVYHRTFTVPAEWTGRRIYLNLAGAKSGVYVYVNGREVGYNEDSKSLARYDIGKFLREGENDLLLKIYRYSTGSFLECQDFWRISGIERDVYLSSEANGATLKDFRVVSTLDETLTDGLFRLHVEGNIPDFGWQLLDRKDSLVVEGQGSVRDTASFEAVIPNVRKWSAETPELYQLILRVGDEYTRFHVGFRRLEIREYPLNDERTVHCFLVNGQPVKFKGVNLHEHNEFTGHYTDRNLILQDLTLMRAANINAIRTSHYPQQREFYELCDSLGFYVYDEANIESHAMGYKLDRTLGNNTDWYVKHEDRVLNMYRRTANYPCVTILSLGNEAGNGENFYRCYNLLKELEKDAQNRPVCYERAEREWNTDMLVPQYPGADWFHQMGEEENERPVCPSEYAHAMGNSTGSLDLQWDAIRAWPHLQGAFIWDWVDQGLAETDSLGHKYWTYGGDYGKDVPSDANFLCNGIVNPDRNPHPGYWEVRHVYQDAAVEGRIPEKGAFRLVNRFYFRDLNDYKLSYTIFADGEKVKDGVFAFNELVTVGPQGYFDFTLPMPKFEAKKEYFINFSLTALHDGLLVKKGQEIASDQILLHDPELAPKAPARVPVNVYENEERIVLTAGKAELEFDRGLGRITYWRIDGDDLVDPAFGIRPNYWRGPTDNDYGNGLPLRDQAWKQASLAPEVDSLAVSDSGRITVRYKLPNGAKLVGTIEMLAGGALRIGSDFIGGDRPDRPVEWKDQKPEQANDLPRIGIRTRVPQGQWSRFRYYGRGPEENYCDRFSGSFVGVYESTPEQEFYPYVRPQETGHHIDMRWLEGTSFTVQAVDDPFECNVLKQYLEDLDSEGRHTHLNDIPVRETVEISIDGCMAGVGGYDSWGAWPEHERNLWDNRNYSWRVLLVPNK